MKILSIGLSRGGVQTLSYQNLVMYCKATSNGADTSGNGNAFTSVSGSWLAGTFVGTMPNSTAVKEAIGHVIGVADWAYGADDLPVANLAQATIIANSNTYNLIATAKGVAIYDPYAVASTKITKADKVLKYTPVYDPSDTAFFNGVDTTGMTSFTSGIQWVPDNLGVLKLSPTNHMGRQGMRVLATLADYAAAGVAPVYGSELLTTAQQQCDSGWNTIGESTANNGLLRLYSSAGAWSAVNSPVSLVVGKTYVMSYTVVQSVTGAMKENTTSVFLPNVLGTNSVAIIATGTVIGFGRRDTGLPCDVSLDNISIRELLPTYYDTAADDTPIVTSVPQTTKTYDAGFSASTRDTSTSKRYNPANPLTMPGFLCEPARTNKCTCVKANPTATTNIAGGGAYLTVANAVAGSLANSFDESGVSVNLTSICSTGKIYRCVNTSGGALFINVGGETATLNPHTYSVFYKTTSSTIRLRAAGGDSEGSLTLPPSTAGFTRKSVTGTPTIPRALELRVPDGQSIDLILPQLEEGAFCTSPIVGADTTASATRAATVLTYPTAGKIRSNNMAFRKVIVPKATGQSGVWIKASYTDASNYTGLLLDPTTITLRKRIAGTNNDATVSVTHAAGVSLEVVCVRASTFGAQLAVRAFTGGTWGAWTVGTAVTAAGAKANAIIAAGYQLGALNSISQFTGNIPLFETLPIPTGITDPLAWAMKEWGLNTILNDSTVINDGDLLW